MIQASAAEGDSHDAWQASRGLSRVADEGTVPVNSRSKLATVRRFVRAGVAMGNIYVNQEVDNGADTARSGYDKGWASGYLAAMTTVDRFVSDTISGKAHRVVDDREAGGIAG
jgi:hypothetical protein